MSLLTDCKVDSDDGDTHCYYKDGTVAGLNEGLAPAVVLHDNKLHMMLFLFDAKGTSFLTIRAALQAKYGAPCKSETQPWQSRAGAHYDNLVVTWCFKTGHLVLDQLSTNLDYGDLIYTDEVNRGPAKAPKVDF